MRSERVSTRWPRRGRRIATAAAGVFLLLPLLAVVGGGAPMAVAGGGGAQHEPVYVGVEVCSRCHSGPSAGHQFSKWRASAHADAYAALWSDNARAIAKLSGIPEEPQEAGMCLGCHATAADVEDWQREGAFVVEDGVQCERCHGAGSEYMAAEVMRDPARARKAGLMQPTPAMCMNCHRVKGSHVAVLGSADFDVEAGLAGHRPSRGRQAAANDAARRRVHRTSAATGEPGRAASTSGVQRCGGCHRGERIGYQFSKWRLSAHARRRMPGWATGGGGRPRHASCRAEVQGDPQQADACLRCHAPQLVSGKGKAGTAASAASLVLGRDGVQCEAVTARAARTRRRRSCAIGRPRCRRACSLVRRSGARSATPVAKATATSST